MILSRFPSENNKHEKARLRPASGTQTYLVDSGDPRAVIVGLWPSSVAKGYGVLPGKASQRAERSNCVRESRQSRCKHRFAHRCPVASLPLKAPLPSVRQRSDMVQYVSAVGGMGE